MEMGRLFTVEVTVLTWRSEDGVGWKRAERNACCFTWI